MSRSFYSQMVDAALAFLFQPECIACAAGVTSGPLCGSCRDFFPLAPPWCEKCGEPMAASLSRCGRCWKGALDGLRSLWWLNEAGLALMHHVKFGGKFQYLSAALEEVPPPVFEGPLIPVPVSRGRLKERGFNQAERISDWIGGEVLRIGLIKVRETAPQSLLGRAERLKNLKGVFSWNPKVPPPPRAVLIDDIFTTGSTLEACAVALKRAGVKKVEAWTLFRAPRLPPDEAN